MQTSCEVFCKIELKLQNMLNTYISYVCVFVIIIAAIWAGKYISNKVKNGELLTKRKVIESLPTIISTLGVLFTFGGISWGLYNFNTSNINESIPTLLEGLKTAFYTSIAGMFGSLVLSYRVNRLYDKKEKGVSDINQAASQICNSVSQMSKDNAATIDKLTRLMEQQSQTQTAFYNSMGSLMSQITQQMAAIPQMQQAIANMEVNTSTLSVLARSQETSMKAISENMDNTLLETRSNGTLLDKMNTSLSSQLSTTNSALSSMDKNIGEMVEATSGLYTTTESMNTEIHTFSKIIRSSIDETNELLTRKFDEFSELLEKSNTESLVKVMEKVTEEFQKQMHDLISRLIKQNFDQLNQSVERLNKWQIENKEMIATLTAQYKTMADNFEKNSTTLTAVTNDTKQLVSDGGKLKQLINSLNQVLLEDKNFEKLTKQLLDSAKLTKDNMTEFEDSTRNLNEWVRKNRSFVEQVQLLINKLEELNKLRDYSQEFWRETKKGMEDGVNIIQRGSKALDSQLTNLDARFYTRLSTTLAELDKCIQAMVNGNNNNRR